MTDCATCVVYATIDDFELLGLPAGALANLSFKAQSAILQAASRQVDTFLRNRYHLPLRCPIDPALTLWTCQIASYLSLSVRGFNPNANAIDQVIRMNYDDAIKALVRVANGQQQLCVVQTEAPSLQPQMSSSPTRGFSTPDGIDPPFVGPNTWGI
jgi:phage gp36-like protein